MRQSPTGADSDKASMTMILLWVTIGIFVLQQVINVAFPGLNSGIENGLSSAWFALSGENAREYKLWTLVSYGFLHDTTGFLHIFGNMLGLFFIGRIVEPLIGRKEFLYLYLAGALLGGLCYLGFHFSDGPYAYINGKAVYSSLVGASASVAALLALFCLIYPERTITLLLMFIIPITIKPKWVLRIYGAITAGGLIFFELHGQTSIAHSAHLGGLICGIGYFKFFYSTGGSAFSSGSFDKPSVELPDWFKRRKKTESVVTYQVNRRSKTDVQKEVDRILDKINTSGFGSLSDDEKSTLDEAKDLLSR